MKKALSLIIAVIAFSCNTKKETQVLTEEAPQEKTPVVAVKKDARLIGPAKSSEQLLIEEAIEKIEAAKNDPLIGYWVGMFGKNKINIALAEIKDGKALGYTVCAGNFRPITGTVKISGDVYAFDMLEPGTDQYDGHFQFSIDKKENELNGMWTPFKKDAASAKEFALKKTNYVYQTDLGTYPESSSRVLEESEVENLLSEELQLMRNEIYARHGYSFKDKADRRYFDTIQWYIPMGIDIREKLTDVEVINIDLIYRYENYLEDHYDDYGR